MCKTPASIRRQGFVVYEGSFSYPSSVGFGKYRKRVYYREKGTIMEWRNVPGYARYAISISTKEGMCLSLDYKGKGVKRLLSNNPKKSGRIYWSLSDENGKRVCRQAARWVAITFPELVQGEYFEGAEIDHIDGILIAEYPSVREAMRKTGISDGNIHTSCRGKRAYAGGYVWRFKY